ITTLTASATTPNPSVFGQVLTFIASVAAAAPGAGTPSGTVTFKDGNVVLGTAPISGGSALVSTTALAVGSHTITAVYTGDTNFTTSASAPLTQVVNQAGTTTTVSTLPATSVYGQPVTFFATVVAQAPGSGTPTGTVTHLDGGAPLATVSLSGGAVLTKANL